MMEQQASIDGLCISKSVKMFERPAEAGTDGSQLGSPFFSKLNYDVRTIIYDNLYMLLPPLARKPFDEGEVGKIECIGLIMCCKRANKELCVAAARHLKLWADDILPILERDSGCPVSLYRSTCSNQGWQAMRSITVRLDVRFLNSLSKYGLTNDEKNDRLRRNYYQYRLEIPFWFHKLSDNRDPGNRLYNFEHLLRLPFDKVTIVLDSSDDTVYGVESQHECLSIKKRIVTEISENIAGLLQDSFKRIIVLGKMKIRQTLDFRQRDLYDTNDLMPHDCQGLHFDNKEACRDCYEDCADHWECSKRFSPDSYYEGALTRQHDSSEGFVCNGFDPRCGYVHRPIENRPTENRPTENRPTENRPTENRPTENKRPEPQRRCNQEIPDDAFLCGPKRAKYASLIQYRLARLQWCRIRRHRVDFHGVGRPEWDPAIPHFDWVNRRTYDWFWNDSYASSSVQTKKIAIAWDFRDAASRVEHLEEKLTGRRIRCNSKTVKGIASDNDGGCFGVPNQNKSEWDGPFDRKDSKDRKDSWYEYYKRWPFPKLVDGKDGKTHHTLNGVQEITAEERAEHFGHLPQSDEEYDEVWPLRWSLESKDGMVGEQGIANYERWWPSHLTSNAFLMGHSGTFIKECEIERDPAQGSRFEDVESSGIGMPIVKRTTQSGTEDTDSNNKY